MNENDVPTRAQIQDELKKVLKVGGVTVDDKMDRNTQRSDQVQQMLLNVPGLVSTERDKILDDLKSYPDWEDA